MSNSRQSKGLADSFKKKHIEGNHPKGKPVNDKGDFDQTRYKSLRPEGSGSGSRSQGTKPGQTMSVTRQKVDTVNTGSVNHGQTGSHHYAAVGKNEGKGSVNKTFEGHHLEGKAKKIGKKKYLVKGEVLEEASSSSTADFLV